MKTVTLQFIPHSGKSLEYAGGVRVNVADGQPMVRVAKHRGYKKTVTVFVQALKNLSMVTADGKIVWLA